MIPYEINGLPAHVLLLHAVVVLVPLTSLLVVGTAFWPAARRRLGVAVPILALVTLGAVQLTINAGEWLIRRVPITPLVRAHAHLGDDMLPWAIALVVVAVAVWAQRFLPSHRTDAGNDHTARAEGTARADPGPPTTGPGAGHTQTLTRATTAPTGRRSRLATVVAGVTMVAALAAGVGATVQCYRVGDAGARAVWTDNFSTQPLPRTPPPPT
ncbi:hypothetical protein [Pseudonocardia sp.]|jgi:hypothetical protein|uniref:hypothetical protein n=1 Tax=Pseudonocardia sp. TaxID=60912 RepID=UPI0031FD6031